MCLPVIPGVFRPQPVCVDRVFMCMCYTAEYMIKYSTEFHNQSISYFASGNERTDCHYDRELMEELLGIYDCSTGTSLQNCIYKVREWAKIVHKKISDPVDFSKRLFTVGQIVDDLLLVDCSVNQVKLLVNTRCNLFLIFSTLLDLFLRTGRKKQLQAPIYEHCDMWKERIRLLLNCMNEYMDNPISSPRFIIAYEVSDVHAVLKQLKILPGCQLFSASDIEEWVACCSILLSKNRTSLFVPSTQDTLRTACGKRPFISGKDKSEKPLQQKMMKFSTEKTSLSLSSVRIEDEPAGGLAVYRICYFIEELCCRLDLPLEARHLAMEIFHSYVVLSQSSPPVADITNQCTAASKTFAHYCQAEREVEEGSEAMDLTIRHFSTIYHAPNTATPVFWSYSRRKSLIATPLPNNRCEPDFLAVAVSAILLASKVMIDTVDAFPVPKLNVLLTQVESLLLHSPCSPHVRLLLCESETKACVPNTAEELKLKIFQYEGRFLREVLFDASYWHGTISSTLRHIADLNLQSITESMVAEATRTWGEPVWWFSNISARASKTELGLAALVISSCDNAALHFLEWCTALNVCPVVAQALIDEVRRLYTEVYPVIRAALNVGE